MVGTIGKKLIFIKNSYNKPSKKKKKKKKKKKEEGRKKLSKLVFILYFEF